MNRAREFGKRGCGAGMAAGRPKRPGGRRQRYGWLVSAAVASAMLAWWGAAAPAADDVALVADGQPAATIVIPDEPGELAQWPRTHAVGHSFYPGPIVPKDRPATVEYAAMFLQEYIERMSGAVLPIVRASGAPADGTRVLIGRCAGMADFGIDPDTLKPEGFRIKTGLRGVAVVGETAPKDSHAAGYDRGTLFGVYELLERLGVRWYFPGELGTIVPERKTITVPAMDVTDAPFLWLRAGGVSGNAAAWHPCLRTGGSSRLAVNHTAFWWGRYFSVEHAEYFTMDPDGRRRIGHPESTQDNHLCYSQPALVAQELANIEAYENGDTRSYFWGDSANLKPNDRYIYHCPADCVTTKGECFCPDCLRLRRNGHWRAKHSETVYGFQTRLARAVAEKWPGRRVAVLTGYDSFVWPPRTVDWPENLDMMYVIARGPQMQVDPVVRDEEDRLFREWQALVNGDRNRMSVWLYYCYPEMFSEAPMLAPDALARWYQTYGPHIAGVYNNGLRDRALTGRRTFPMVYLSGRLQWNPEADVHAILAEFYRLSFGPAERPMAAVFGRLIDRWEHARWGDVPASIEVPNRVIYRDVYRPEDIRLILDELESAVAATDDGSLFRRRVEWWVEGFQPFIHEARQFHAHLDRQPVWEAARLAAAPPLTWGPAWEPVASKPLMELTMGDPPALGTDIRVAYDANALYVLARATETNTHGLAVAARDGEDPDILKDDTMALQIWTGRGRLAMPSFHEIRVNPEGVVSKAIVPEPFFYDGFHHSDRFVWPVTNIATAVAIGDGGWTAGIAVPWSAIPAWNGTMPPQVRLQVERRKAGPPVERTVLSPILGMSYEYPLDRFGTVILP